MKTAYDVAELGEIVKQELINAGLPGAAEIALEKVGKAAYEGVKKWAKESAVLSENKIDDFVAGFYDQVDAIVVPQIEKLDLDGDGV